MGIFLSLRIVRPIFFLLAVLSATFIAIASGEIIGTADGKIFIRARNESLRSVVAIFHKDFAVEIKGLATLENEKVTFAFEAASREELIKGLLRHLNIKNYAFEFAGEKLKIVIIVPGAKRSISSPVDSDTDSTKREEIVSVAVINSVVESSQAESLDLLQGDFIVEYDGIRINSASQLVKEVEKRSVKNQIEMLVVRDKTPMRLIIQGGFIGVRITTEKISKPEYLNYF
jgi:predicted metalloprotease with PDZ domain